MALSKVWAVIAQEIENQLTNLKLVGFNGFMFGSVASITSICTGEAPLIKVTCQKFSPVMPIFHARREPGTETSA